MTIFRTLAMAPFCHCRRLTLFAKSTLPFFWSCPTHHMRRFISLRVVCSVASLSCSAAFRRHYVAPVLHTRANNDPSCTFINESMNSFSMDDVYFYRPQVCNATVSDSFVPLPLKSNKQFRRCALVGGSNRVNGSRWGNEIDSHDLVIRINRHRWDPKDGGQKTDVYFMADSSDDVVPTRSMCSGNECKPIIVGGFSFSDGCVSPHPWYLLGHKLVNATAKLIKSTSTARPHSGMLLSLVALKSCRSITLYGISIGEDAMATFWNMTNAYVSSGHDDIIVNEYLVLVQMRRCGWDIREAGNMAFG